MRLNFSEIQRSGNETIKGIDIHKRFDDKVLFEDANMMVNYGERVALLGANGSGKTTFLKMLLGEMQADSGHVELGASVNAAYLPQEVTFNNEELTVLECFRDDTVILEGKAREYLAKFMFYGKRVFTKVKFLSGGERIRLKLARLLFDDVNLLILDEPTNHLDIESIETFEEALDGFEGTIFFISHDRYFINKISERIVAIENYGFESYDGNYNYYKEARDECVGKSIFELSERTEKSDKKKKTIEKPVTKQPLDTVKIEKLEGRIKELEDAMSEIDLRMVACGDDYEALDELYNQKCELNQELETVWEEWEQAQDTLRQMLG